MQDHRQGDERIGTFPASRFSSRRGEKIVAATSTELDGTYQLRVPPGATYHAHRRAHRIREGRTDLALGEARCRAKEKPISRCALNAAKRDGPAGTPEGATAAPRAGGAGRFEAARGANRIDGQPRVLR